MKGPMVMFVFSLLMLYSIPLRIPARRTTGTIAAKGNAGDAQPDSQIERGKYLVEEVAKCPECHTPRKENGELDEHAWLHGAPIWIMPVRHVASWADSVPPLAGLPGLTDEEAERVLEKGMGPEGETLRPPMHIYHMHPEDAKAIIAYLKSVPRGTT